MPIARGILKRVVFAKETTFGTAGITGLSMRRTNSVFNAQKAGFQTDEILPSQQLRDVRHGAYSIPGSMSGPLAPGAFPMVFESIMRRDFTASVSTGAVTTIASNATTKTLTRSAGSYITDGFRVGDIVNQTGWVSPATANNNVYARIMSLSATVMTLDLLAVTKAAGDTVTVVRVGKKTYLPPTGQTNPSFSVEHWYSDLSQSELFLGVRSTQVAVNIPASGVAMVSSQYIGQKMQTGAVVQYGSPSSVSYYDSVTGVSGSLMVNGVAYAIVTSAQFAITSSVMAQPVIGSQFVPDIFLGRLSAAGSFTAYMDGVTLRDLFMNETAVSLNIWLKNASADNADFICFHFPRIKLMGSDANDSDTAVFRQFSFIATENTSSSANEELTTVSIQDSQA